MMREDEISFTAKTDLLIAHYGESYLKSQKRERKEYSCSNKMRELARLLITYRASVNDNSIAFKDLLHPEKFEGVVSATRKLSGFDPINKTYEAPSTALHMGTSLKVVSDELIHLILKRSPGFICESPEKSLEWRKNVKNFKMLVGTRWNTEISSVANKDLNEKRWERPLLVPLIDDVKMFREKTLEFAKECQKHFLENTDTDDTYKLFVNCTLALLVLFNRRRIGDVQYLKIKDYLSERKTNFKDFESTLSEGEKILTKHYKRVLNGGKGSRAVVILVPEVLQDFLNLIIKKRDKYISADNKYIFAIPNSKIQWSQADVAIRYLTKKMKLKNPAAISSNRLRKHIATTMQILSMSQQDCKQFSKFMGHTEKTHEEFYELPVDIYQTAKVVKLLILMEEGIPTQHKGKSLSEIEINLNEYVDEMQPESSESAIQQEQTENHEGDENEKRRLNYLDTDEENNDVPSKKRPKTKKQAWSIEEIALIQKHFGNDMKKGRYPLSSEIKKFIASNHSKRSVLQIKAKMQHLMTKQKAN
ncbi:unnamed protein product [Callosobruchus maculatus]|uniref:Uncharacterized protein n=2 Tax=Callosobruchus maculatus TaxID=64391 RepID=A0A653C7T3_CALMS|nr:unnamed protein product [Callosobruchus maculatus]